MLNDIPLTADADVEAARNCSSLKRKRRKAKTIRRRDKIEITKRAKRERRATQTAVGGSR